MQKQLSKDELSRDAPDHNPALSINDFSILIANNIFPHALDVNRRNVLENLLKDFAYEIIRRSTEP